MLIYLDNAATTYPKPESVYQAAEKAMREGGGNPGRGLHPLALKSTEIVYRTREKVADLFGGNPERVVFTPNATGALNLAIKGLARPGSHILISDIEHNSVLRPVVSLAEQGVRYSIFSSSGSDQDILASIERNLHPSTCLLVACHRSNVAPITLPIEKIGKLCASKGIYFIVDASQSAGSVEISMDRMNIDVLCAPGHKGLFGLMGSGFALFGRHIRAEKIKTIWEGGSGIDSRLQVMPNVLPERLEAGTLAVPAIASLGAGIDYVRLRSIQEIAAYENKLLLELYDRLSEIRKVQLYCRSKEKEGTTLLFNVDGIDAEQVAMLLAKQHICVRSGLHCSPLAHQSLGTPGGAVRVSLSPFNKREDLDSLYYAIQEWL